MKKMLLATALALLITGCAQQTFTVQNKPAAVAPKALIISSFLELGRRKCRCSQNLWRRKKMLLKRNPANIRKWIAQFYYFRHLYSMEARVCIAHNNCMSCIDMETALYTNSLICGSFQLFFCIVISLSLRVK